jgi:hypothetical protein
MGTRPSPVCGFWILRYLGVLLPVSYFFFLPAELVGIIDVLSFGTPAPTAPTASSAADRFFLNWLESHDGFVHPYVEIRTSSSGERGVFVRRTLAAGAVLFKIPLSLGFYGEVIRADTKKLPDDITSAGSFQQVKLALALYEARREGNASLWAPYFQSLPSACPSMFCWSVEKTNCYKQCLFTHNISKIWTVATEYRNHHAKLITRVADLLGYDGGEMMWCFSLVMSRSVFVPNTGLALLPFADLINLRSVELAPALQFTYDLRGPNNKRFSFPLRPRGPRTITFQ